MKNIKDSGRTEANENKNNFGYPIVMDNQGQELTINEKLEMKHRCGYGVRKYSFMADAWYWKAVECDIDNRGLKTAILLNK